MGLSCPRMLFQIASFMVISFVASVTEKSVAADSAAIGAVGRFTSVGGWMGTNAL